MRRGVTIMKLNKNTIDYSSKLPIFILIIILAIGLNSYFFFSEYKLNSEHIKVIHSIEETEMWECIKEEITNLNQSEISEGRFIGKKIENSINKMYGGDLDSLKNNFINNTLDTKFYDMLKKELLYDSIKQNNSSVPNNFNYYIGLKDKPIAHFSNVMDKFNSEDVTWESIFKQYGKNEKENYALISKIFTKDIETDILTLNNDYNIQNNFDMETLKKIYEEYGLEGFKRVTILNVAYITEYGDIFNNDDYLFFDTVNNYKLYLIKASNLYDNLYPRVYIRLRDIQEIYSCELNHYEYTMTRKSIEFVTINVILMIIALVVSIFYNRNYTDNKNK